MRVGGGGGDHYSPTTSGGHIFHTGVSIDAPFVATRSSSLPLRFYPNIERLVKLDRVMGMKDCAWVLNGAEETAYVQVELGIQVRFRTRKYKRIRGMVIGFQKSLDPTADSEEMQLRKQLQPPTNYEQNPYGINPHRFGKTM
ncbi:hypothetical protein PIB30_058651 [Stylosanthes scabra]|uniref:Uncharacterized protein n=1 Tax=Stylosanthes scabra TaxID=79078 RepID=A0ABU6WI82_9FABA|nr:hypothetical protein [Stylosanthes scabra]